MTIRDRWRSPGSRFSNHQSRTARGMIALTFLFLCVIPAPAVAQQQSVADLIEQLQGDDLQGRRDAAYELGQRGPAAAPAVEALIKALDDRDQQVWAFSAGALARIGPAAEAAVERLAADLGQRSDQRRYRAAFALGQIGEAAVPTLVEQLESRSASVRQASALALSWCGDAAEPALDALARQLEDSSEEAADQASRTLGELGPIAEPALTACLDRDAVQALVFALKSLRLSRIQSPETIAKVAALRTHEEAAVRVQVFAALRRSAVDPDQLTEFALSALADPDAEVRREAVVTFASVRPSSPSALESLVALLQSNSEPTKSAAASALGQLGEQAVPVLDQLAASMSDDPQANSMEREIFASVGPAAVPYLLQALANRQLDSAAAASTFIQMGQPAVPALCTAYPSATPPGKQAIVLALSEFEDQSAEVVETLVAALDDNDENVTRFAIRALGKIEPLPANILTRLRDSLRNATGVDRAVLLTTIAMQSEADDEQLQEIVASALEDESPDVRAAAALSVQHVGLSDSIEPEQWQQLMQDSAEQVRRATAEALAVRTTNRRATVGWLTKLLEDSSSQVKRQAVVSLHELDRYSPEVVAGLTKLFAESDLSLVILAVETIQQLNDQAESAIPEIQTLAQHPDAAVRQAVAIALGELKTQAETTVPVLLRMLDDSAWPVRNAATVALAEFEDASVSAVPRLVELMSSEEDREAARAALRKIDLVTDDAIKPLIDALASDEVRVQYIAVYLLGKAGSAAADALPQLREMRDQGDSRFRRYVQETIDKIEAE